MGLITRWKERQQVKQILLQLGGTGGITPSYYANGDSFLNNEAGASCIQTNAMYSSKVEFSSVRIKANGEKVHDYPELDKMLQYRPNPLMTASVFWERTRTYYDKYSNAFIYQEKDPFGRLIALWSIDPSSVNFDHIETGEILLRFTVNGQTQIIPYSNIIHIAKNVSGSAIFGDNANEPIRRVIEMINLNYKGIENAILTSTFIRFICEQNTKMSKAELKKKAKEFTDTYLNVNAKDRASVIFTDSSFKMTTLDGKDQKTANYMESTSWNAAVYKFFGCPEKIIAGTATEEEMLAYYERSLEPFFIRAAQEMTTKIFTPLEYSRGNRIVFSDLSLQYRSMSTRLEIFKSAREIGAFTLGTLGDLLGLPVPNDKRDVVVTSQNYNDSLQSQQTPPDDAGGEGDK